MPAALLVVALFVYTRALGWGLPAGDETWAADALKPSAPLAVAYNSFLAHGWNSGWFWFKYPPFHAYLLCALYAPYLALLWLTGGVHGFSSDFPFGLRDPMTSLTNLALIARAASAAMGAGSVMLAYACVVRSFGRRAAAGAAFVLTFAYPMVFYSQTTNVEVPYLFWMLVALLGAVRIVEGDERARWWVLLGVGAALSVSTKELVAGVLVGLPLAIVGACIAAGLPLLSWIRGGLVAALAFAVAMALANNAIWNPLGFAHRIGFLTQTLPREVALRYAPYYFPIDLSGNRGAGVEIAQLRLAILRLATSLGWPTLVLALAGFAVALRRRPAWALLLLTATVSFYLISVRAMLALSLRYLLPLTAIFSIAAGIALAELVREGSARALRIAAAAALVVYVIVYGWDVDRMMTGDGRYAAEKWLTTTAAAQARGASAAAQARGASAAALARGAMAAAGPRVEIYQNRTYLPRFPAGMTVEEVGYESRGIAAFASRHPDLVVISSSGIAGITVRYKQDWQEDAAAEEGYTPATKGATGDYMTFTRDENVEFLDKLRNGELGYVEAARFSVTPWIERPLIQSLDPEITIYRRDDFQKPSAEQR